MDEVAIKVEELSKDFKLPYEKNTTIKSAVLNFWTRKRGYEIQHALSDVNVEVKKGEFFGIVGRNGSGKSTLLKLLAGIYTPTNGQVHIGGSLTPFIELGVGFNPELTGRENVFLNGALLGFNRKEMHAMYDDIVEFAELKKFMDQKLKNYSSGMQVRLAFSIAVRAKSDILLIDEVLAVGDLNFQEKCFNYFEALKKEGRTIIFISHDMSSIRRFCDRTALLIDGRIKFIGDPEQVADLYEKQNASSMPSLDQGTEISEGIEIEKLVIKSPQKKSFNSNDRIILQFTIKTKRELEAVVGINITKGGQFIAGLTSQSQIKPQIFKPRKKIIYEFEFSCDQLTPGYFAVDGVIYEIGNHTPAFFKGSMAEFKILDAVSGWGALNLKGEWRNR